MTRFVVQRLVGGLVTIWLAVSLTFLAIHLVPGDPAHAALNQSTAPEAVLEQRRAALGLDQPGIVQYGRYLLGLTHADLGLSWSANQPVSFLIGQQLAPTMSLAVAGTLAAVVVGTLLGIGAGIGQEAVLGELARGAAGFLLSVPVMFSGMVLIAVFAVRFRFLPGTGQGSLSHLLLPAAAVGLSGAGGIARVVEAGISDQMDQSFVHLASAKGLRRSRVLIRHALRVGLLPALDAVALQLGYLFGGAVITEAVFARQGIGRLLLQAVLDKDLPLVQGIVILSVVVYTVVNFVADISHALLDPRLRGSVTSR